MKKVLFIALCIAAAATAAAENSQWRGAYRDGIYDEKGLLKAWPDSCPKLLWHYDGLGQGHTSAAVANGKIYVTGMDADSMGNLFVLDLSTGKLLAKKTYGMEWSANWHGTRSTVNVNDGKLYIFSGRGVMYCLDEKTLEPVWTKDFLHEFDGKNLKFGMTESPLIVGDVLYATPGGKVNNFVALNKNTGALIWSSKGNGQTSSYCSPLYVSGFAVPLLVNAMDSALVGINASTGEFLWSVYQRSRSGHSPNTPIYSDGHLFSTVGGGMGSMLLKITNGGRSVEQVWHAEMDNKMGGAVKIGNYVFGSGEKNRYWYCLDWSTGAVKYKSNALGVGNIIASVGNLYCYSDKGELALVRATPDKFDIVSKCRITLGTEQHWAHPVIHNGVLYVRHGNTMMAYKIK